MPATYEPIATTTLSTSASSITFSSIPGTYTDLKVVIVALGSGIGYFRFNNNSTNYSQTYLIGDGSTAFSGRYTSQTEIYYGLTGMSTTIPFFGEIDVFSYAGSTNKTTLNTYSADKNGSGETEKIVGLWRNTAAITRVDLYTTGTFNSGTAATLYGILKA